MEEMCLCGGSSPQGVVDENRDSSYWVLVTLAGRLRLPLNKLRVLLVEASDSKCNPDAWHSAHSQQLCFMPPNPCLANKKVKRRGTTPLTFTYIYIYRSLHVCEVVETQMLERLVPLMPRETMTSKRETSQSGRVSSSLTRGIYAATPRANVYLCHANPLLTHFPRYYSRSLIHANSSTDLNRAAPTPYPN